MRSVEWAVGVFEGEGCISIQTPSDRPRPRVVLVVNMTDEDVVRSFHAAAGTGEVYGPKYNGTGRKPSYQWRASARTDVSRLLNEWLPLLHERRASRAREALAALS